MGCNYCCGDEAVFYKDNENCVFVGMNGEMLAIAKDRSIRFKVNHCPMCGRSFGVGQEAENVLHTENMR